MSFRSNHWHAIVLCNLLKANVSFKWNQWPANVSFESNQPWANVYFKTHVLQVFYSFCYYIIHKVWSYIKLNWLYIQFTCVSFERKCNSCVTKVDLTNNDKSLGIDSFEVNNWGWEPAKINLISFYYRIWNPIQIQTNQSANASFELPVLTVVQVFFHSAIWLSLDMLVMNNSGWGYTEYHVISLYDNG